MQTEAFSFPSTGQGKDKIWQTAFLKFFVSTDSYFSPYFQIFQL